MANLIFSPRKYTNGRYVNLKYFVKAPLRTPIN